MAKTINSYEIKDRFVVLEVSNGKDDGTLEKEKILLIRMSGTKISLHHKYLFNVKSIL